MIVAIGHTTDNSLLDEICRYAAQTPSEAATHLLSILTTRQQSLTSLYASIHTAAVSYHTKMTPLLTQTYEFIRYLFRSRLEQYHQQLEHARSAIRCFSPETIYAKGFATVHSSDGSFLSAQKLKALQTGTKITIKTVN